MPPKQRNSPLSPVYNALLKVTECIILNGGLKVIKLEFFSSEWSNRQRSQTVTSLSFAFSSVLLQIVKAKLLVPDSPSAQLSTKS